MKGLENQLGFLVMEGSGIWSYYVVSSCYPAMNPLVCLLGNKNGDGTRVSMKALNLMPLDGARWTLFGLCLAHPMTMLTHGPGCTKEDSPLSRLLSAAVLRF